MCSIEKTRETKQAKKNGTYVEPKSVICGCGKCGLMTTPGSKYIRGHHSRVYSSFNDQKVIEKSKETCRKNGVYKRTSIRMTEHNPMDKKENREKMVKNREENGFSEKASKRMTKWRKTYVQTQKTTDKINKKNWENGNYDRFIKNNPTKNPVSLKIIVDKHKIWCRTNEGKEVLSNNGKKAMETLLSNSTYIWQGVHFLSKEEMLVAQTILTIPIKGINCHIQINGKTIDFFPQIGDKHFVGSFVEYHPNFKMLDSRSSEEYYQDRINIINKSNLKDVPLILITSLKELKEEMKDVRK